MFLKVQKFLFENISLKQTIFKNTFWLALAELVSRLLEAVLFIYIARILGAEDFGKFAFALATSSIFIAFSSMGFSDVFTREFSGSKEVKKEYSAVLTLKIILGILAIFLAIIASFFITVDRTIILMIGTLAVFYFFNDIFLFIYSFLRSYQKMEYESAFKIFRSLVLLAVALFIIFESPSLINISLGYLSANIFALILVLIFFHFKIYSLKLDFNISIWKKFLKLSWPIGLAAIFGAIFINADSVILGYFNLIVENGWYGAARRTVAIIIIPSSLVSMSFYPVLSQLFLESKAKMQKVWNYYLGSMIIFALPVTFGGVVVASKIIDFIYGQNFSPATLIFQILIFIAGINFVYSAYSIMLIVSRHQEKYLFINMTAALMNVILNFVLISLYGPYGAAVAAVITYIILFFMAVVLLQKFSIITTFNIYLFRVLILSVIATAIMLISISLPIIQSLNAIFLVSFGICIYFIVFSGLYKAFQKKWKFPRLILFKYD
jgi:O-antigen/teichoic acid export membrane protein